MVERELKKTAFERADNGPSNVERADIFMVGAHQPTADEARLVGAMRSMIVRDRLRQYRRRRHR